MSELKKGYIVSALFHLMILGPVFLSGRLLFDSRKSNTLDMGFSFHLKPLGNSLEKTISPNSERPRNAIEKDPDTKKGIGEEMQKPPEKRYGVNDGSEGVDEFYIAENYRTIMGTIGNRLLYPEIARNMGWQGKVLVSFVIDTDGKITEISIKESSGYAILDTSAIRTIRSIRGIPKPDTPTRITVPIAFLLN